MRICMLLGGTYPPDIRVEKEAHALLTAGHDVTLLCRGGDDEPLHERVDGIGVIRLRRRDSIERASDLVSGLWNLATGVYPRWLRALDRALSAGVDAVHVHDLPLVRTALSATAGRDVPVVADLHENYPEAVRQWRRQRSDDPLVWQAYRTVESTAMPIERLSRLERSCVNRVDRVLTVCEEAKRHYLTDCGAPPDRVRIVSNTVSLDRFDALLSGSAPRIAALEHGRNAMTDAGVGPNETTAQPDGSREFVVTYAGRLGVHRGLEPVFDAFAAFEQRIDTPTRLVIVGPNSSDNARVLQARARQLGISERVSFTGWVDFERVPRYMAASDIGLVPHAETPHTRTTIPHKLFQYMAAGTPVVVTDVLPLERVVEKANAGLVVPATNAGALCEAFTALHGDPDRARAFGRNGRRAVEADYRWQRDANRLRAVYRELANDGLIAAMNASNEPRPGAGRSSSRTSS